MAPPASSNEHAASPPPERSLVIVRYKDGQSMLDLPNQTYSTFLDRIGKAYGIQPEDVVCMEKLVPNVGFVCVDLGAWDEQAALQDNADVPVYRIIHSQSPEAPAHGKAIRIGVDTPLCGRVSPSRLGRTPPTLTSFFLAAGRLSEQQLDL